MSGGGAGVARCAQSTVARRHMSRIVRRSARRALESPRSGKSEVHVQGPGCGRTVQPRRGAQRSRRAAARSGAGRAAAGVPMLPLHPPGLQQLRAYLRSSSSPRRCGGAHEAHATMTAAARRASNTRAQGLPNPGRLASPSRRSSAMIVLFQAQRVASKAAAGCAKPPVPICPSHRSSRQQQRPQATSTWLAISPAPSGRASS